MTPFFMPVIGTQLRLEADLTFRLHSEHRNNSLFRALGLMEERTFTRRYAGGKPHTWTGLYRRIEPGTEFDPSEPWRGGGHIGVTLPAGTVLQVDRIYLRKGSEDFDSLTFLLVDSPDERLKPWKRIKPGAKAAFNAAIRFWIKLPEMQGIPVTWLTAPATPGFRPENAALHDTRRDPY